MYVKSGTVSMNEPLEARRRIMNPSRSPHRTDNTQNTSSSQKWGNFYKFAVLPMESTEVERSFSFIRKILTWLPILIYDHRTTLRFGLHRQMQLPLIEAWFVRNLWLCTLDEWRRPHFWTKLLFLLFCGVSRLCNVTVYNSSFPKSPCFGTNIGQLKIN